MTFDQIVYFLEAAKQEHFGRASKILHVSPSALSHAVAGLQEELGQVFFEKSGKNIFLTAAGRAFVPRATELYSLMIKLKEDFSKGPITSKEYWRVACSHGLSEVVASCWGENKGELMTLRSAQIIESVLNGDIDFGVCFSPQSHIKLTASKLYSGDLNLVVRANHPLHLKLLNSKKLKIFSIEDLSSYSACLPKAFQGIEVCQDHPMFKMHNISVSPGILFDNYGVALKRILNSDDWSFIPDIFLQEKGFFVLPKPKNWNAPFTIEMISLKTALKLSFEKRLAEDLKVAFLQKQNDLS